MNYGDGEKNTKTKSGQNQYIFNIDKNKDCAISFVCVKKRIYNMARDKLNVTIERKTDQDNIYEKVDVDLFEYLQNSQNSESILVVSDIRLPKAKKRSVPNFSNVVMSSKIFDAGDWCINTDSVLPSGMSELICLHSISSIGDLIGVLPASVQIVRVRNSVLNNVGKKEDISIAKSFAEFYPDVIVYDERGQTLFQKITEKTQTTGAIQKNIAVESDCEMSKVAIKMADWISADDFVAYVKSENLLVGLSDSDLKRYFQLARSTNADLKIESQSMLRADNVCVVHKIPRYRYCHRLYQSNTETPVRKIRKKEIAQKSDNTTSISQSQAVKQKETCYYNGQLVTKT